ncbi:hypothetical protein BGZ79_004650, partial [Entomortierella chlamydospora]
MSGDLLNLFCLVDGEPTSNAFPVSISRTSTVGELKKIIRTEKSPEFDDIAADKLAVWRVSIPVVPDNRLTRRTLRLTNGKAEILPANLGLAEPDPIELDPTDVPFDIFQEKSPQNEVRIFVRPLPKALSVSDVLLLRLPVLSWTPLMRSTTTATDSVYARTPTEVQAWTGFAAEAAAMEYSTDRTINANEIRFINEFSLVDENSVCFALEANIYYNLNRVFPNAKIGRYCETNVIGKLDRVYFRSRADIRMIIEIKTIRSLPCNDLATGYNEEMEAFARDEALPDRTRRPLHQIFGYLSHNRLRYGILSTYDQTWFLKREGGSLQISPTIYHNNNYPTLLQCYAYVMHLSDKDPISEAAPPTPSPSPPPEDPSDGNDNNDDPNDSNYHEGRDTAIREMGRRESGFLSKSKIKIKQMLRPRRRNTNAAVRETVALKTCDLYKNPEFKNGMLREVALYKALKNLQGVCIPHFKVAGYDGGIFSIAIELARSPIEEDNLSYQEHLKVVDT